MGARTHRIGIGLIIGVLVAACVAAEEPDYTQAEFTYPSDPTRELLHVSSAGTMIKSTHSMTLTGDGTLTLRSNHEGREEEYTSLLENREVEQLLRLAVDHGLAEWDETRVQAKQLDVTRGRGATTPTDASRAHVRLSIDDYGRGSYRARRGQAVHPRLCGVVPEKALSGA